MAKVPQLDRKIVVTETKEIHDRSKVVGVIQV